MMMVRVDSRPYTHLVLLLLILDPWSIFFPGVYWSNAQRPNLNGATLVTTASRGLQNAGDETTTTSLNCDYAIMTLFTSYVRISGLHLPQADGGENNATTAREQSETISASFIYSYNNLQDTACTDSEGQRGGRKIDEVVVLHFWVGANEILLMVNATCAGCFLTDANNGESPLFLSEQLVHDDNHMDSAANDIMETGNKTSSCLCDPPSQEEFAHTFRQDLAKLLPIASATVGSPSPNITLSPNATFSPLDISQLNTADCESSAGNRESYSTTIILFLEDDGRIHNSSTDEESNFFGFVADAVVEAYNVANNKKYINDDIQHNDYHCDPFDRQIDSVDAWFILDQDDITLAYVIDNLKEADDHDGQDGGRSNSSAILLETTLSCVGCGGDGHKRRAFDVLQNYGMKTATMMMDRIEDSEEPPTTSCHCPTIGADETITDKNLLRGPTHEEFQEQLANILASTSTMLDFPSRNNTTSFVHADEVSTVACSTTPGGVGPEQTSIAEVVIVDFLVNCSLVDSDLTSLADQFVETYNTLTREKYCDPYFRQIISANVLERGETRFDESAGSSTLTIEMELVGSCIGCDADIDGFYYVPDEVPNKSNEDVSISEALNTEVTHIDTNSTFGMNITGTNYTVTTNSTVVNNNNTRHLRHLEAAGSQYQAGQNGACYCPNRAVAARAPSEAEVMHAFRIAVQESEVMLRCVSSVGECQFGTRFEASFLVAFWDSNSTFDFATDIEVGFQNTLNSLFYTSPPGVCQPDFRLTQGASATIGVNLLEEEVRRSPTNRDRRAQQDTLTESNMTDSSAVPSSTPNPTTLYPTIALSGIWQSPTVSTTVYPTITESESERPHVVPTASPTIFTGSSVLLVLIHVGGVCNGCSNDRILYNQLSETTSRKLEDEDQYHHFSRTLQATESVPDSNCFCPIESVVQETSPSLERILEVYQRQLDDSNVPLDVQGIQEVQVLDCDDEVEEVDIHLVLRFSLHSEVSNSELVQLVDLIQDTYNDLTDQEYCDPLFRRIKGLDLVSMERLESGQNGCDLYAVTFDGLGSCRGCEGGSSLFDTEGDNDSERRLMRQQDTHLHEHIATDDMEKDQSVRRRRLDGSELCLCERHTGADRAPSVEEFGQALGPELERMDFSSVCGLADKFEAFTDTPSNLPSVFPSESPSACTTSLENELATKIVFFVEKGDGLESDIGHQLGLALERAYNEIMNDTRTVCDPLYRVVTSATLTMNDGQGLFHYTLAGQCGSCSTDSNIFDVLVRDDVLLRSRDLVAPFLNNAKILDMMEVDQIPCSNLVVEFEEVVIVELVPACREEENLGFNEAVLATIEETFVATYNQLSELYCDEFFKVLVNAKVENLGTITDDGNVPIEIRVFAECLGCDPDEVEIYGHPSALRTDKSGVENSDASNRALENAVNNVLNREIWNAEGGRFLQGADSCVCSAQALANRSPSEAEFLDAFRQRVESLPLDCVASVGECKFGSSFNTDMVISFEGNATTLTDAVRRTIQESFQGLLNELYQPSKEECNPEFRMVQDVEVGFDFTLNGEFIETSSSAAMDDDSPGRFLLGPDRKNRREQAVIPTSLNPSMSPSPVPTTRLGATLSQISTADSTMSPSFASNTVATSSPNQALAGGPSILSRPTSSPTLVLDPNIVRTLLTVSGVCNGCVNELFLSNQILSGSARRGLRHRQKTGLGDHDFDMEYFLDRRLQDERAANSNCFCPLTATAKIIPPSVEEVQGRLNRRLEEKNVNLTVKDIEAVSAIDCDAEEETTTFESEFTFSFSAVVGVSDVEITKLGATIQAVYNDLVEDYCDPLIRREATLKLTDRRRVIASAASVSSRRDLQGEGVDPALDQGPLCVNFEATFDVEGLCRGCEDGTPLLDISRALSSKVHDRLLSNGRRSSQQRTRRRRLMNAEEECFCDSSTVAPRAPNVDEIWVRMQPELESFVGICGKPVECDPALMVSQFSETTILALLLEPGTVVSEVEMLELEEAYMTAYNDIQNRLRVDKCGGRFRQLTSLTADRSILGANADVGEERAAPHSIGGGRRLDVKSFVFAGSGGCTRDCEPGDDLDILREMVDPIESLGFVKEVLAVNEYLTGAPSRTPSLRPSEAPSTRPSVLPSESPSSYPSMSPSAGPSTLPSSFPSKYPTVSPSAYPSGFPSALPSTTPSQIPSLLPSSSPSEAPSSRPSSMPTTFPSSAPSVLPSMAPSLKPSDSPSVLPSLAPSSVPSFIPSMSPSSTPSILPSRVPSLKPSVLPSALPSLAPSSIPSKMPSSGPSFTPSQFPTIAPSSSPVSCYDELCETQYGLNDDLPTLATCTFSSPESCMCNGPTCPDCIGTDACLGTAGPVGGNSCLEQRSCQDATDSIGSNSCIGLDICRRSKVPIPDDACHGYYMCRDCSYDISAGECKDPSDYASCPCLPTFGAGSCLDGSARSACWGLSGTKESTLIGTNSCTATWSCASIQDTHIDDSSCTGNHACLSVKNSNIGSGSCGNTHSCSYQNGVTVGVNSCTAAFSCQNFSGNSIGANACTEANACQHCSVDVGDGECSGGFCPCN